MTIYCPLWSGGLQQLPLTGSIWLLTTTLMVCLLGKSGNLTIIILCQPASVNINKKINHLITIFSPFSSLSNSWNSFLMSKKVMFTMFGSSRLVWKMIQKHSTKFRSRLIFGTDRCRFHDTDFLCFLAAHQLDRSHHALMQWGQISSSRPCYGCHMLLGHSFGNQQLG